MQPCLHMIVVRSYECCEFDDLLGLMLRFSFRRPNVRVVPTGMYTYRYVILFSSHISFEVSSFYAHLALALGTRASHFSILLAVFVRKPHCHRYSLRLALLPTDWHLQPNNVLCLMSWVSF
jgi:hypothetical protein